MSLQINYFILPEIVNHLGLITADMIERIAEVVLGLTFKRDDEE